MSEEKKKPARKTTSSAKPKAKAEHTEDKPKKVVVQHAHTEEGKSHAAVVVKKSSTSKSDQYRHKVQYQGTGRRKNAVARVMLIPGSGKIVVNNSDNAEAYFGNRPTLMKVLRRPLVTAGIEGQFDVIINVVGGGITGQAGAVSHGIARAIIEMNPDIKKQLKVEGLVTRDPRVKETKKYGRKKARKGFTYRKR